MAFLRAHWRDLLMINWSIPPDRVSPWVPAGCEVDCFQGQTFASLVAFQFRRTRVLGIPVPGHVNFEEVNLRLYVKRVMPSGEVRRGVVFVREIVPRRLIAWVARTVYGEPYVYLPMSHRRLLGDGNDGDGNDGDGNDGDDNDGDDDDQRLELVYRWGDHQMEAVADGPWQDLVEGSESQFIAEHYWGYTANPSGTREYRVSHPPWRVRTLRSLRMQVDMGSLYGDQWSDLTETQPSSQFVAEGSDVTVDPWKAE